MDHGLSNDEKSDSNKDGEGKLAHFKTSVFPSSQKTTSRLTLMNLAKISASSAFKSTINISPTINLSVLETQLQKCRNINQFNQILSQIISNSFIQDTYAASRVLKFSTESSFIHLDYSRRIFNAVEDPNAFTWNTMMKAYLKANTCREVFSLYKMMMINYVAPDYYTCPILIQVCSTQTSEVAGKQIHGHVGKLGFDSDIYVRNALINMYGVYGNMSCARQLFDESPVLDSISWNSILAGYVRMGDAEEATWIFNQMPKDNIIASNSMIALFGRLGRVGDASRIFYDMDERDMVSWSTLISSYEQNEMYLEALIVFREMVDNAVRIDEVVVVSVLSACAHLLKIVEGRLVHGLIVKNGIESYINLQNACIHMYASCGDMVAAARLFDCCYWLDLVSLNSMISGYSKCGLLGIARSLFDLMTEKDVISWSAMIAGYAQNGRFTEALSLFQEMQLADCRPDETTLVSVVSACTHLTALNHGKSIHGYIRKTISKLDVVLWTTLIDMYMKCGCVKNALEVFHGMEERPVSSWNAIILGLAMNGLVDRSLEKFSEMKRCGVSPNEITFIGVLGACRHMGLVDEGRQYFDSMVKKHNIQPNIKHYGCMVDLLGRAGLLKEAEELITGMTMAPNVATWGALLAACKKHGDNEMGERIGRKLTELKPDHDGCFHTMLSNMYASRGNWNDVLEIRERMTKHGIMKIPGCSVVEAN